MFYDVTAVLHFTEEDEARDFYHDCEIALAKAQVVNPGQPDQECSIIEHLDNHHDIHPTEPCTLTEHQDNCPIEQI